MTFRGLVRRTVPFIVRRRVGIALWRLRLAARRLLPAATAAPTVVELPQESPVSGSWIVPALLDPNEPGAPISVPASGDPMVTIVIPARNSWPQTYRCLGAVAAHSGEVEIEVILVDDGSTDATARAAVSVAGGLRVVRLSGVGFLRACNAGAKEAHGKLLLLLNNDTIPQPGWLEPLVAVLEQDETVGIVGAKLVSEDGSVLEAGCTVFRDGGAANDGRGSDPRESGLQYQRETDYVSGACLLIRRPLWDEIGGFDERYGPGYYEDVDLAFEARRRGYRVVCEPRSTVVHVEGASHGVDLEAGIKRYQVLNRPVFVDKWGETLRREHPTVGTMRPERNRRSATGRAVVIDHEVPQPDRDAGSRFVLHYIELLAELGYSVAFVSAFGGDVSPYADDLRNAGVEVVLPPWTAERMRSWLAREAQDGLDAVCVHRHFVAAEWIPALRDATTARIVYSPVDLSFIRQRRRFELDGTSGADVQANRLEAEELHLLASADAVHVVSRYEEELVRELVPGSEVRTVPIFIYGDGASRSGRSFDQRANLMFVAGFLHEPNPDAARWLIEEIQPLVRREIPEALILLVGSNPPPEVVRLAGDGVIVTGRVTDATLETLYSQTRVVVCPLRFGAGVKGKVVESLFHGVPAVVTPIAAEGLPDIEEHVLVAESAEEFAARVVELYSDSALWNRLQARAKPYVERTFSRSTAIDVIRRDFMPRKRSAPTRVD